MDVFALMVENEIELEFDDDMVTAQYRSLRTGGFYSLQLDIADYKSKRDAAENAVLKAIQKRKETVR